MVGGEKRRGEVRERRRRKRLERERELRRGQSCGRKREEKRRGGGDEVKLDQVILEHKRGHKETSRSREGEESNVGKCRRREMEVEREI